MNEKLSKLDSALYPTIALVQDIIYDKSLDIAYHERLHLDTEYQKIVTQLYNNFKRLITCK
jgi:hypothetical protein